MYNEIKLIVEKIFTTEQYMLNMKYKTPDIIDYILRNIAKEDIGKSNSIITPINNNRCNVIVNLNSCKKFIILGKLITYHGIPSFLISVPIEIRDDDFPAKLKMEKIYKIIYKLIERFTPPAMEINVSLASCIIAMDIFMSLYNETEYILEHFISIQEFEEDRNRIKRIYTYILENDNSTSKLLDDYEVYRLLN